MWRAKLSSSSSDMPQDGPKSFLAWHRNSSASRSMSWWSTVLPKRLQLLKEVVPSASRVAVLLDPDSSGSMPQLKRIQAAAPSLGLTVLPVEVKARGRDDID